MQICKHCGWEIEKETSIKGFSEWFDKLGGSDCGRDGDGRYTQHEPQVTINGGVKPERIN